VEQKPTAGEGVVVIQAWHRGGKEGWRGTKREGERQWDGIHVSHTCRILCYTTNGTQYIIPRHLEPGSQEQTKRSKVWFSCLCSSPVASSAVLTSITHPCAQAMLSTALEKGNPRSDTAWTWHILTLVFSLVRRPPLNTS
jgi:hypothetical protein